MGNAPLMETTLDAAKPRLVFLVGSPRSGTTWLQKLLGNHPEIGTAQESHIFNHFLGSMISSWDHLVNFEDGRGGIGIPAYQRESAFLQMLNQQVHDVLSNADEYHKGSVFLEKTPDHIRHMHDIQRVIPDARIILINREPADVIESMLNAATGWGKNWAPGSIFKAIRLFRYFSMKADNDLKNLDTTNLLCVSYEELRESTPKVLEEILNYLNLPFDDLLIKTLIDSDLELKRYGEFASKNGNTVQEPEGFARSKKGKLSWWQKIIINVTIGKQSINISQINKGQNKIEGLGNK